MSVLRLFKELEGRAPSPSRVMTPNSMHDAFSMTPTGWLGFRMKLARLDSLVRLAKLS